MAEIIKIMENGVPFELINVSSSVGKGGVNDRDDVMVVQALFRYLTPAKRGGVPDKKCPLPTGTFNKATEKLIKKYKRLNRERLELEMQEEEYLEANSVIFPMRGSIYFAGGTKQMLIALLNSDAHDVSVLSNKKPNNYIQGLLDEFPQISNALGRIEL